MSKKLKVGIVGCGGIANHKHLPSLSLLKQVEVTAFCDADSGRAAATAQKFGSSEALVYTDYTELLKDDSLDVVHVCTANDMHAEVSIRALEAGKHVMCEKPMAKTAADARRMLEAARRSGKKLTIAYQNRFRPDSLQMKKICDSGMLGDIYLAKAHAVRRRGVPNRGVFLDKEKQGGGPLIDIGTHALDLTLWMMDNYRPQMVVGSVYHKLGPRGSEANPLGPWDPEQFTVEDSAFAMIKMENGATVMLESSWLLNIADEGTGKVTLCGTEAGADMWGGLRVNGEQLGRLYLNQIKLEEKTLNLSENRRESPAEMEARLWIEAILHDTEPVVKPEQALVVSEILEAIYVSAETGKPVFFNEAGEMRS